MRLGRFLGKLGVAAALGFAASAAQAVLIPGPFEMDLDNWTRLYCRAEGVATCGSVSNGQPIPEGAPPALGYESRAFLKINDISPTAGPGGGDLPPTWIAGVTDGTFLFGVERNVIIDAMFTNAIGETTIYFDHVTTDPDDPAYWELRLWQTGITTAEFEENGAGTNAGSFLGLGPSNFDAIQTALDGDASSTEILRGRFATSTYYDPVEDVADNAAFDFSAGVHTAVVAIKIPLTTLGGIWVDQVTTPFGLAVNAFVDVDPTFGLGGTLIDGLYGDPSYDLAIQNVRLFSELEINVNCTPSGGDPNACAGPPPTPAASTGGNWIISDDGIRGAVPEPGSMALIGVALLALGIARRRRQR